MMFLQKQCKGTTFLNGTCAIVCIHPHSYAIKSTMMVMRASLLIFCSRATRAMRQGMDACVISSSRQDGNLISAKPENGSPPCPKKNSCNSWRMIPSCVKTGTTSTATECRNLSLSVNTLTRPHSKRHSIGAYNKQNTNY